jgi:hypothetical protein
MNDLIPPSGPGARPPLPAFAAPAVREALAWASVRVARDALPPPDRDAMHIGARPSVPIPTEAEQGEAAAARARLAPALAPATLDEWKAFLRPIAAGCRNPPGPDDFDVRARGIGSTCADLPRGALTRAAILRMKPGFFPGAEDVVAACEPEVRRLRAEAEVLDAMAHGPTTSHPLHAAVGKRVTPDEFRRWFAPLRILRREEERRPAPRGAEVVTNAFTLSAPSRFHADRVRQEYGHLLAQGLGGRVEFEVVAAGSVH